jgi:hypothetical protein
MKEAIFVTDNDEKIRNDLHGKYDSQGLELINSQATYIAWHWNNPSDAAIADIKSYPELKGIIQIS